MYTFFKGVSNLHWKNLKTGGNERRFPSQEKGNFSNFTEKLGKILENFDQSGKIISENIAFQCPNVTLCTPTQEKVVGAIRSYIPKGDSRCSWVSLCTAPTLGQFVKFQTATGLVEGWQAQVTLCYTTLDIVLNSQESIR